MYIFLNNSIIDGTQPCIKFNDRGLLLGDGIFETMKHSGNKIISLDKHINRLKKSLKYLNIPMPGRINDLSCICKDLILKNNINFNKTIAIRVTVTRGKSDRGINIPKEQNPNLIISITPYTNIDNIIRASLTSVVRNEYSALTTLKVIQYLEPIMARKEAQDKGYDEGIMLNTKNNITESSAANIFFVKNDEIITPKISDGVLPGIVREIIISECKKSGILLTERSVRQEELSDFIEVFQTNSLIDVQSISQIDDVKFKVGVEANITNKVKELYKKAISQ